ncbi:sirohydrochlorin cobaltochelatase [Sporomusaceae bacterium BoRhaA]|uniref:sirohydrochlorin cobaltochelatase n=1 Tax=Pelorhabdus rhamnosifermentans TaxID=2772457 RepID=UPI001C0614D6|nr:sirohydrochlorin cobaltochelatase [Pelorhabdus rhamnosifermentans]MBU2700286.1 sirohydrochlorin cobaltochelatase [Pelorhabdus rhamnosifermentans]
MLQQKAILVVSSGTIYREALQSSIESIENKIREAFPDYEVRRAFTSRKVIKTWEERNGIHVDTEQEALERLQTEKYKEVLIQPLHLVVGEEYEKIKWIVSHYVHAKLKVFEHVAIGRPLLYYMGLNGKSDDYLNAIQALKKQLPPLGREEAVVLVGHSKIHPVNTAYAALQLKMEETGWKHVFIYTIEGFPELHHVIAKLKKARIKKVMLMPFLLMADEQVEHALASHDDSSVKSQLSKAGFEVATYLHGLGENEAIQQLYVQHLLDLMCPIDRSKDCKH